MPDDKTYAVIFRSPAEGPADLRLTLYSASFTYSVRLNGVAFVNAADKPSPNAPGGYSESQPAFITHPKADLSIGASVEPTSPPPQGACEPQYSLTDYLLKGLSPTYVSSETRRLERVRLDHAFALGVTAVPIETTVQNAAGCDRPFTPARIKDSVAPNLSFKPADVTQASVGVAVSLDSAGKITDVRLVQPSGYRAIDDAVLDAARRSTYDPATFLCRNIASVYQTRLALRSTTRVIRIGR